MERTYEVIALSAPIYYNRHGDHNHDGLIFTLKKNLDILQERKRLIEERKPEPDDERLKKLSPLVRPLVLRACVGDTVRVRLTNCISPQPVTVIPKPDQKDKEPKKFVKRHKIGLHLVSDGYGVESDGTHVGNNPSSLLDYNEERDYIWKCNHEGVFVFHDAGNMSGSDKYGTNANGLFGALVVEPEGSWWTDPEIGIDAEIEDGLYADVHQKPRNVLKTMADGAKAPYPNVNNPASRPQRYHYDDVIFPSSDKSELKKSFDQRPDHARKASFREYVIFFHDEPQWVAPHTDLAKEKSPCDHSPHHQQDEHDDHTRHSLMPISYRAEPMISREKLLWQRMNKGEKIDPVVVNEEQHHSSWMFGDPDTPVLKAYLGDPVRIRLVHAGVKETHVFHLHVYEWYAAHQDPYSPLIDAITISPQTGHTFIPLYGAGNRQSVPGDVIWHCHLYPHFHHGMWGIFRTFDTRQEGKPGSLIDGQTEEVITHIISDTEQRTVKPFKDRKIGQYPDGTPIRKLAVLPDRQSPPDPTPQRPGFPLFIPGVNGQKSPTPPWPGDFSTMDKKLDYRPVSSLERNAFNTQPRAGELFTVFPNPDFGTAADKAPTVRHTINVAMRSARYNQDNKKEGYWYDPYAHMYELADGTTKPGLTPDEQKNPHGEFVEPKKYEPLYFRCREGDVMELTLSNKLPKVIPGNHFDKRMPECKEFDAWYGECGLHVHIVKFDPIAGDGAATGWNYMSAPRFGKEMRYRWWADEEFGVIFCHDHLFANFRQKHGLFGALLVEPKGATFHDPKDHNKQIVAGQQAVIKYNDAAGKARAFREFCVGLTDWVPMYKKLTAEETEEEIKALHKEIADKEQERNHTTDPKEKARLDKEIKYLKNSVEWMRTFGKPLEEPNEPGDHDDNGVFGVNYRCTPLLQRGLEPSNWFFKADPDTAVFETNANEPVWIRLVQGAHEEQHSFQVHGMRWKRFRNNPASPVRNQQTLGLSEVFTFKIEDPYTDGDYLWKFASIEDQWLGCWGLIRAHRGNKLPEIPKLAGLPPLPPTTDTSIQTLCRRFVVVAEKRTVFYGGQVLDPDGMIYRLAAYAAPGEDFTEVKPSNLIEPLVIRCRQDEWVQVTLINNLPNSISGGKFEPELPVDDEKPRKVSSEVSLHADLVTLDIKTSDGANVGKNQRQSVGPGKSIKYLWYIDKSYEGPVLLQDMADVRNHRHHGLVGALIVEPAGATPLAVGNNAATAPSKKDEAWYGTRATIVKGSKRTEECVLVLQDGLQLLYDDDLPVPNMSGDRVGQEPDTEDQGMKGFNYRSSLLLNMGNAFDKKAPFDSYQELREAFDLKTEGSKSEPDLPTITMAGQTPVTPLWRVPTGAAVKMCLVGAVDKPRNHSFMIHGHAWKEHPHLGDNAEKFSSESGISCGTVRTYAFTAATPGDYVYRSGVLKWAVAQGLWGILRVE